MALTAADLISLEFTPDLTQTGIDAVRRRLPSLGARPGGVSFNALRAEVAHNAAQLALLRYLSKQDIPYQMDAAGLHLGGRKVQVVIDLLTRKRQISALLDQSSGWLGRPLPDFAEDARADIFLFMAVMGLVTKGRSDLEAAREAEQPHCLIYPMPKVLARPAAWKPLGEMALKLEKGEELEIELAGQDEERRFVTQKISLKEGESVQVEGTFYSLTHLRTSELPAGRLALRGDALAEALVIKPKEWGNLWVYGMQILVQGYATKSEWVDMSKAGSTTIENLRPMSDLMGRVRDWAGSNPQS